MMTVSQLIDRLLHADPNMIVLLDGGDGELFPIDEIVKDMVLEPKDNPGMFFFKDNEIDVTTNDKEALVIR